MSFFEDLLKSRAEKAVKVINFEAIVKSVDESKDTIVIQQIDGPEVSGVKLKSILSNEANKLVVYPKVNSFVTVSVLYNVETELYVTQVSTIDKIVIKTDNVGVTISDKVEITADEIVINNGDNGGLVKWSSVKAELDKTNAVVNAIVQSLTGWTPTPNDGGAALKLYASTQLAGKQVGNYNDKEDTKVKH